MAGRERLTIEGVILDISEQKRLEDDLQRALVEALGASVLKSRLITNTTHELMTPLTVIYGMNEMMLDTDRDAMQRSLVVRIGKAGRRLRALIRDMLDFAKLSEGNLELKPRDIDLRQFIESVGRLEEPAAAEKRLELLWTVDPGTPACIFSDPARLRQVLRILVANAVKFSDQGKVALGASPPWAPRPLRSSSASPTPVLASPRPTAPRSSNPSGRPTCPTAGAKAVQH